MTTEKVKLTNARHCKHWTEQEIAFLSENWHNGKSYCAKRLNRTLDAIIAKGKKLKLGDIVSATGCFTASEVAGILGIDNHIVTKWIKNELLPSRSAFKKRNVYLIEFDDLEKFLEIYQHLWNSHKMKESLWINEPVWMRKKRQDDYINRSKKQYTKWTPEEDKLLISSYKSGAYKNKEIADRLGRSRSAIQNRLKRLDVWGTGEVIG